MAYRGCVASRDLLVFELDGMLFGIDARRVDSVIAWRKPVPLPQGAPPILGVVQDRGRIITVLRHPTAEVPGSEHTDAAHARLVVCETPRGHLGLPASSARTVGTVELEDEPRHGAVVSGSEGSLTFLDPSQLVAAVSGTP